MFKYIINVLRRNCSCYLVVEPHIDRGRPRPPHYHRALVVSTWLKSFFSCELSIALQLFLGFKSLLLILTIGWNHMI